MESGREGTSINVYWTLMTLERKMNTDRRGNVKKPPENILREVD